MFTLLKAWKYILPLALALWGMYERNGRQACESGWAAAKLEAANALLEQKVKDTKLQQEIQAKLDDAHLALANRSTTIIERYRDVPVTTGCNTPVMRRSDDDMRSLGFVPETGTPLGKNTGVAPAPGAGANRPQR